MEVYTLYEFVPGLGAITYNFSPNNKASSTECVIRIIVFPVSFQIFKTKDCIFSLVKASRAPNGSSIKIRFWVID